MTKIKQTLILGSTLSITSFILLFINTSNLLIALSPTLCIAILLLFITTQSKSAQTSSSEAFNKVSASVTLYIGNLPYKANEDAIKNYFEKVSKVISVRLMKDKRTGRKKGFGFIEVEKSAAKAVITQLNDSVFMERNLIVRPAKDKVA
ncbi:RNA recognition motif domain-containing protein [Agaribacter flavus]|uniref:RNA recognition motif domain-containing protein n=1 Tax=Agaribacter flavus TaxID=1902781 RepID=A0ABV7FPH8_9ALTE